MLTLFWPQRIRNSSWRCHQASPPCIQIIQWIQWIFVCKWGPATAILSGAENMMISHRVKERKGRTEWVPEGADVGRGMKGHQIWRGLLLFQKVCYIWCIRVFVAQHFPPQSKCILNPHHIGILFYLPRSSSLHPSYPSFITAALPSDIDLGRVATAALQLNTPEALRKAQMRCGAMDHIDLWSTVLILGSATAPSLSGHMCHSSPML